MLQDESAHSGQQRKIIWLQFYALKLQREENKMLHIRADHVTWGFGIYISQIFSKAQPTWRCGDKVTPLTDAAIGDT